MLKNQAGQKFDLFAVDSATGLAKIGDGPNITAYLSKDDGPVTQLADSTATEIDPANAAGSYAFDASQDETNADKLYVTGKSTTPGVVIYPSTYFTFGPSSGIDQSSSPPGTSISTVVPYATPQRVLAYLDIRRVCDLCGDYVTPVIAAVDIPTNNRFLTCIRRACGEVEAACMVGGRYAATDLANLTNPADRAAGKISASEELLVGLIADLTFGYLYDVRGFAKQGEETSLPQFERALDRLQQLREGERIFGIQPVVDAGVMADEVDDCFDLEDRDLAVFQAGRLFGTRADEDKRFRSCR